MAEAPTNELSAGRLVTEIVGSRILVYDSIESTNDRALECSEDGTVVAADCQTAGRGRHGRSWHSAPGKGLWVSVALKGSPEGLAFAAPLAVHGALNPLTPNRVKWPNDILIGGKKVCGVLIEHRAGISVLGIGINVNHDRGDFPEELQETATSLKIQLGKQVDRNAVFQSLLTELDKRIVAIRAGKLAAVRDEWAATCAITGKRIRNAGQEGVVERIAEDGGLIVNSGDTKFAVRFGDIVEVENT